MKHLFDRGSGPPVIVIPGVQGRWEWMRPGLEALSGSCRTISYSLCGDFGSGMRGDPALGFDNYLRQLDRVANRVNDDRFAVCGVSYGGWIALRYAATHPDRVSALVLVSAPAPGWQPNPRQRRYIRQPWLGAPLFALTGPFRIWPEVRAALGGWPSRLWFGVTHGLRVLAAPMIPSLMAERVHQQMALDFTADCQMVRVPTLVVTGEEGLDSVVPVHVTRRYRDLIPGARYEILRRTGHIGIVTQPERFARVVGDFIHASSH